MSLLGQYTKQPVEVEVYGIQFAEDMSDSDQIQSCFQILSRDATEAWDQVVRTTSYIAQLTDNGKVLVTTADVTLPVDALDGFYVCVSNKNQASAINVSGISIPARGGSILLRKNGAWVEEAKINSVLVDSIGDQRVRVWVHGGTPWEMYKVQVTVTTSESRVMQDEFTVEIEEV